MGLSAVTNDGVTRQKAQRFLILQSQISCGVAIIKVSSCLAIKNTATRSPSQMPIRVIYLPAMGMNQQKNLELLLCLRLFLRNLACQRPSEAIMACLLPAQMH